MLRSQPFWVSSDVNSHCNVKNLNLHSSLDKEAAKLATKFKNFKQLVKQGLNFKSSSFAVIMKNSVSTEKFGSGS